MVTYNCDKCAKLLDGDEVINVTVDDPNGDSADWELCRQCRRNLVKYLDEKVMA